MIRRVVVLVSCITGLVIYSLISADFESSPLVAIAGRLFGTNSDASVYVTRFAASALLLGCIPLLATLATRRPVASIGLGWPIRFSGLRWSLLFLLIGLAIGVGGSFDHELSTVYPYRPNLLGLSGSEAVVGFGVHALLYLVLYYVAWELTFRGVLVVFVTEPFTRSPPVAEGAVVVIALLQAAPSAMLHYGHPTSETLGALLFGFVAGYVALVSRSILPGLIVHASAGISLDLVLMLRGT